MALTELQRDILRLLAPSRLERESYVAGGAALNTQLRAPRRSRDIDLFHDTIEAEIDLLDFDGTAPTAADIGRRWRRQLEEADAICELLPIDDLGSAVVVDNGRLCRLDVPALDDALERKTVSFHRGAIGGAWPVFP